MTEVVVEHKTVDRVADGPSAAAIAPLGTLSYVPSELKRPPVCMRLSDTDYVPSPISSRPCRARSAFSTATWNRTGP